MELAIALILFLALVLTWFFLPGGSTTVVAPETTAWTSNEKLVSAEA